MHRAGWVGSIVLIAWWTLLPFSPDLSPTALQRALADIQWVPFVERGRAPLWSDVLGNVTLFLPFGVAAWRALERHRYRLAGVLLSATLVSCVVEVLQLALPARRTSATDLVVDVCGAACGAVVGRLWEVRGRRAATQWWRRLTGGGRENVLVVVFAACLLVWAVLPGVAVPGQVWEQTQRLSASFRHFPGWERWVPQAWHPMLLGAIFSTLAGRSGNGSSLGRGVFGFGAATLLGLVMELMQLAAPGRRPDIFSVVGFGAGGLLALVLSGAPVLLVRVAAVALVGAGLIRAPQGDNPEFQTLTVLIFGGFLMLVAAAPRLRSSVGEGVGLD